MNFSHGALAYWLICNCIIYIFFQANMIEPAGCIKESRFSVISLTIWFICCNLFFVHGQQMRYLTFSINYLIGLLRRCCSFLSIIFFIYFYINNLTWCFVSFIFEASHDISIITRIKKTNIFETSLCCITTQAKVILCKYQ